MPEMRTIDVGELSLRCAIEGPGAGTAPLAIMVHGCRMIAWTSGSLIAPRVM